MKTRREIQAELWTKYIDARTAWCALPFKDRCYGTDYDGPELGALGRAKAEHEQYKDETERIGLDTPASPPPGERQEREKHDSVDPLIALVPVEELGDWDAELFRIGNPITDYNPVHGEMMAAIIEANKKSAALLRGYISEYL